MGVFQCSGVSEHTSREDFWREGGRGMEVPSCRSMVETAEHRNT